MQKLRYPFIVLSAPSGVGKTTIAKMLVQHHPELSISISATTRPQRPGEVNGKDYFFISEKEFKENINKNNFLEYEEVHGDLYGTLMTEVEKLVNQGKSVVFDIDVKGALSIKRKYPEAILFFLKAPSLDELVNRLKNRKSESRQAIEKRLRRIDFENAQAEKFDYIIVNDKLKKTVADIESIILNEA